MTTNLKSTLHVYHAGSELTHDTGLAVHEPTLPGVRMLMWPIVLSGKGVSTSPDITLEMAPYRRHMKIKATSAEAEIAFGTTRSSRGESVTTVTQIPRRDSTCFKNDEQWKDFRLAYAHMVSTRRLEPVFRHRQRRPDGTEIEVNIVDDPRWRTPDGRHELALEWVDGALPPRWLYVGTAGADVDMITLVQAWARSAVRHGLPYYSGDPGSDDLRQLIRGRTSWRVEWGFASRPSSEGEEESTKAYWLPKDLFDKLVEVITKGWPAVVPSWIAPNTRVMYQLNGSADGSCLGTAELRTTLPTRMRIERSRFAAGTLELPANNNKMVGVPQLFLDEMHMVYDHLLRRDAKGTRGDRIAIATELTRGYPYVFVSEDWEPRLLRIVGGDLKGVTELKHYKVPERTGELAVDFWERMKPVVPDPDDEEEEDEEEPDPNVCPHCRERPYGVRTAYSTESATALEEVMMAAYEEQCARDGDVVSAAAEVWVCDCGNTFIWEEDYTADEWYGFNLRRTFVSKDDPASLEAVRRTGRTANPATVAGAMAVAEGVIIVPQETPCGCQPPPATPEAESRWHFCACRMRWGVHPVTLEKLPCVRVTVSGDSMLLYGTGECMTQSSVRRLLGHPFVDGMNYEQEIRGAWYTSDWIRRLPTSDWGLPIIHKEEFDRKIAGLTASAAPTWARQFSTPELVARRNANFERHAS